MWLADAAPLAPWLDAVLVAVRLMVGGVMLYYGVPKMRDLRSNAQDFVKMGLRPGMLWGTIVAAVETVGGAAIVLGVYAWLAAALFGFEMLAGAAWKLTRAGKPFTDYSYDLLLLALCLLILATGAGRYALA